MPYKFVNYKSYLYNTFIISIFFRCNIYGYNMKFVLLEFTDLSWLTINTVRSLYRFFKLMYDRVYCHVFKMFGNILITFWRLRIIIIPT